MERLKSLTEEGEYPKSRIGSADNARQLVNALKYEEQTRLVRRTKIQGLLDGNSPWQHQTLIDIGQGHRTNFNLREGEGVVEAAKTPYYDLVFEVPRFANIVFNHAEADPQLSFEWSEIISDEYHETLDAWDGFDKVIQLHQWQMIVYGVGPILWPHSLNWKSEACKVGKVLVPQMTNADVDDLEICVVLHSYRADELEGFIRNRKSAQVSGWDTSLCEKAIIDSAKHDMQEQWGLENFDLYQRAIRTGDIFYGTNRSDRIFVASLFVKEFGNKVSHYIITDPAGYEEASAPRQHINVDEDEVDYLYVRKNKYDSFAEVVCPFFFDTGPDGTWHSVKGLGPKIYDFCDISNRMTCQMIDGAIIGSGVTLEAQDANSLEETQLVMIGGGTVVQPGYKVVQTRIAEALNGTIAMKRELQNTLQSNTGSYRQRVSGEDEEPTLGQAQLNAQQQALLSKGAVNRYYKGLDRFHRETLRRLLSPRLGAGDPGGSEAVEFRERCEKRGIPMEFLKMSNVLRVKANRSLGYGSPQLRDIATKELMSMMPFMSEEGKNNTLRTRGASLPGVGQSNVDAFFPPLRKIAPPEQQVTDATQENNFLRQLGGQTKVDSTQNHPTHFDVHFKDAIDHIQHMSKGQGAGTGGDPHAPTDLLIHLEQAGPHLTQHIQRMANDPTMQEKLPKMKEGLNTLAKVADKLQSEIKKHAQAQASNPQGNGQQGPSVKPEELEPLVRLHSEMQLKAARQSSEIGLQRQKQAHQMRLADLKSAADINLKRKKEALSQRQ